MPCSEVFSGEGSVQTGTVLGRGVGPNRWETLQAASITTVSAAAPCHGPRSTKVCLKSGPEVLKQGSMGAALHVQNTLKISCKLYIHYACHNASMLVACKYQ